MDNVTFKRYKEIKEKLIKFILKEYAEDEYFAIYMDRKNFFLHWKKINDILYMYPEDVMINSPILVNKNTFLLTGRLKK